MITAPDMLIKTKEPPQLRIYTAVGPVALKLRAYRIESDMVVSYIVQDSNVLEMNLGPCTIWNGSGGSFNATEIDDRMKAATAAP
jgi:hypothetical protein